MNKVIKKLHNKKLKNLLRKLVIIIHHFHNLKVSNKTRVYKLTNQALKGTGLLSTIVKKK